MSTYDEKSDPVIYGSLTDDFDPIDWARLALAALDQAGLPLQEQKHIRELVEKQLDIELGAP